MTTDFKHEAKSNRSDLLLVSPVRFGQLVKFFIGSQKMIRGVIDYDEWLTNLCTITESDYAGVFRWTAGDTRQPAVAEVGDAGVLSEGALNWIDYVIEITDPQDAIILSDLVEAIEDEALLAGYPLIDPRVMVLVLDWKPARIIVTLRRKQQYGPWEPADADRMRLVIQHMRQSVQLHKEYDQTSTVARTAMGFIDMSPRGVIGIYPDGHVNFINSLARRFAQSQDGLKLVADKMRLTDIAAERAVAGFLESVRLAQPEHIARLSLDLQVPRPSGRAALHMNLRAMLNGDWHVESTPTDRMVFVTIHDPEIEVLPTEDEVVQFFGVTPAQARIAIRLYAGDKPQEAAHNLSISVNTARSHIQALFNRIGISSQAELVQRLATMLKTENLRFRDEQ